MRGCFACRHFHIHTIEHLYSAVIVLPNHAESLLVSWGDSAAASELWLTYYFVNSKPDFSQRLQRFVYCQMMSFLRQETVKRSYIIMQMISASGLHSPHATTLFCAFKTQWAQVVSPQLSAYPYVHWSNIIFINGFWFCSRRTGEEGGDGFNYLNDRRDRV